MTRFLLLKLLLCLFSLPFSLAANELLPEPWVAYPSANNRDYGVYHYRKTFELDRVPDSLVVHVSADMRYKLYVNGKEVCYGPAKGDLQTWKYDIIDIAPFLNNGTNLIAALVFNQGKDKAMSLFNIQTAFMFRTVNPDFANLNSGPSWKVYKNTAYSPVSYKEMLFDDRWFYGYYACGPGDRLDATSYPWGWETLKYDDSGWKSPEVLVFKGAPPWPLVPRNIAFMDNSRVLPQAVRKATGTALPKKFVQGGQSWTVPANSKATLLLDYELFTMGYPDLKVKGGAGSRIQVNYAEALYEKVNLKGHRDQVDGLEMFGVWDVFKPDGGERTFRPLWKRCFRYVQLSVQTGDKPLEVISHELEYSGYPYPDMASFESDDAHLNEIFEMCQRTLRMCSAETYYDTPYYEQLSYGGDNRPIASNSVYNSTDDRLFREVMRLYPQSAEPDTGLFDSAYPADWDLTMGSWSLVWIQTLNDYWKLRGDLDWVKEIIPPAERVLEFYEQHLDESRGILGPIAELGWQEGNGGVKNFLDWSIIKGSIPRRDGRAISHSTLLTLVYLHTLQTTSELYLALGENEKAAHWQSVARRIQKGVIDHCWNEELGLFKDYPDRDQYSQHTQIFAILTNTISADKQSELMHKVLESDIFTEYVSSYFSFYLFKALGKLDMEDEFLKNLDFWHEYIDRGLTTVGETGFASHDRSDCHAWSAHPSYYLLSYVCGIQPGSIGFDTVRIEPHPGHLKSIKASMPHPKGTIEISYEVLDNKFSATILLPDSLSGEFIVEGEPVVLKPGMNKISAAI